MNTQKDDLGIIGVVVEDWDIAKAFKPKTITTDYSSWISYISRKAVPANTPITNTEYWKPLTRLQTELTIDYNNFKTDITNQFNTLKGLVNSFLTSSKMGIPTVSDFGNSEILSVNQKAITDAFARVWQKFEDLTGEILQGINMVVTPTYFVSEDGCDIHISANTVETNGIFERIQFFVNNELIHEETNAEYVSVDYHLDNKPEYDYVVMCKAKIMGIEYTRQQIVTKYNEFYIGAGSTYTDIMDSTHAKQLSGRMRHNYDVAFAEGDKLIIVMGASLYDGFIRADLNGAEIQLSKETVTIDDKQYVVLTSDTWSEGEYNIDING